MKRLAVKAAMALAAVSLLVASMLVITGCSCSTQQASNSSSASSALPASDLPSYTVPNVLSLTQADAEKAIVASGMMLGTVKQEPSETVPLGCVISQSPEALTQAKANSKVDIVVSSGKPELKDVKVPDLKGKSQEDAEKTLADAGLVGIAGNPEESTDVDPGLVFKQSIDPGTTVKEKTKVTFTVALAPAESTVPDVTGMTREQAKKAIVDAKLGFDYTTSYNSKVDEGKVISQSITPGTKVRAGSTVSVDVSLGAKPEKDVKVPDVMTYSWSKAEAALRSAGLSARYTGDPAGVVVAQDVKAGTKVAPNTLVTVTLACPTEMVEVPNLIGMSVESAEEATDAVKLGLDVTSWHGTVSDQWPAAGTKVETGTTVHATIDDSEFRGGGDDESSSASSSMKAQGDDEGQSDDASDSKLSTQAEPDDEGNGKAGGDEDDSKLSTQAEPDDEGDGNVAGDVDNGKNKAIERNPQAAPVNPTATKKDEGDKEDKSISKDDAKKIALKDMGVKESAVSKIDVKLVKEGTPHYEVTIVANDNHHLYKIDAGSGKILSSKATEGDTEESDTD